MADRTVKITYTGDASKLKSASSDAEKSLSGVHSRSVAVGAGIGSALGTVMGNVAGAGFRALGSAARVGIGEVSDAAKGAAQTASVLKSMGAGAGVTAKGVSDLAGQIQGYSGQTDDSIVASENLLLTFGNLKNGVGEGNDLFNQATKITADMAQTFGGSASDSAVQLGKALNDPTKGISALSRVGVSFTAGQKAQIKAMQEGGDMAGAQKVILGELTKEVGGSAKAFGESLPGQIEKAKRKFEDIAQAVVTRLIPAVMSAGKWVSDNLVPKLRTAAEWVTTNVVPVLGKLADIFTTKVVPAVKKVADFIGGSLVAAFHSIMGPIDAHKEQLGKLFTALGKIATVIASVVGPALVGELGGAMRVAGILIGAAITIIAKLVDIFTWTADKARAFGGGVKSVFNKLRSAVETAINGVKTVINGLKSVFDTVGKVAGTFRDGIKTVFKAIGDAANTVRDVIKGAFTMVGHIVLNIVSMILGVLSNIFGALSHLPFGFGKAFGAAQSSIDKAKAKVDGLNSALDQAAKPRTSTFTVAVRAAVAAGSASAIAMLQSGNYGIGGRTVIGRAGGGPVTAGTPYIVGEHRPELFVPNVNGTIIPDVPGASAGGGGRYSGGGGTTINVTVMGNVMSPDGLARSIAPAIQAELIRTGRRNGGKIF